MTDCKVIALKAPEGWLRPILGAATLLGAQDTANVLNNLPRVTQPTVKEALQVSCGPIPAEK
jgi:hypothetical protein